MNEKQKNGLQKIGKFLKESRITQTIAGTGILAAGLYFNNQAVIEVGNQMVDKPIIVQSPPVTIVEKLPTEQEPEQPRDKPINKIGRAIFGPKE